MARSSEQSSKSNQQTVESAAEVAAANGTSTAETAPADAAPKPERPDLTPEARAKLAEIRSRIETSVGQVALLMMQLPRYRHQALADLNHLVIEPLLQDRVAIAYAKGDEGAADFNPAPVGVAIWASVSDEVAAKIGEQVKAGVFPVRLAADEWASGDNVWLLDILAQSRKAASAVLAHFGNVAGTRGMRLHPLVGQSVDPELLKALQRK